MHEDDATADVPGVIATVQACVAAASNPTSSPPACTSLAAQLTAIFAATPAGVSPIVDQIEATIYTSAGQTLGGALADADNCVNGTDATCASVLQTLTNVEQALVVLAQREENALLTFTQDCVANTNATCHSVFDDIQTLINLSEQEAAFVRLPQPHPCHNHNLLAKQHYREGAPLTNGATFLITRRCSIVRATTHE